MPENRLGKFLEDVRTFPGDAAFGYQIEGVRGVWKAVATRSLHRCFQRGRLVVFAQPLDQPIEISPPDGITIRTVTEADCAVLASLVSRLELVRFREQLRQGRHCVVAFRGPQPVGYGWVAERVGPGIAVWPLPFAFPDYAAYLCNLYVLPSERGNGVGSALARARLHKARELGFREGWRMVAVSNRASLRTIRGESRVIGEVRFLKLLHRTLSRFAPHSSFTGRSADTP